MLPRLSFLLYLLVAATALAGESFWTNENGGEFWEPTNWSHGVPAVADTAQFTNRATYTVRISNSATNSAAFFHRGTVTQDVSGASWFLTNAFRVGEPAGETSRVVLASGSLVVTNSAQNATIEAGRLGTGELAIAGGQVTVDSLLATNRARSILRLGHGELTLLNGGTIDLGTKLFLGASVSNVFTWNLLGGSTRIIDQPFAYGTLTLGGSFPFRSASSRTVLNLIGPDTVLEVPGLDVQESSDDFGGHSLNITAGARLLTRGLQLGLFGSTSNSFLISGPGSAWLADNVYLSMHAGSQTYVITNGGVFEMNTVNFMDNRGNRMAIAGANARFQSHGVARFGIAFCNPACLLDSVVAIQSGGVMLLNELFYGAAGSAPGNLILVEGGRLHIQHLNFATGELNVQSGTGTVQVLNLSGGKNAILRAGDTLLIGHEGDLSSGQLRVGGTDVIIPALNGNVIAPHLELAATPASAAHVTVTGGTVTASSALTLGRAGAASLDVTGGLVTSPIFNAGVQPGATGALTISGHSAEVRTHELHLGRAGAQGIGTVLVTNGGTLEANIFDVHSSRPIQVAGVLQFSTNAPSIPISTVFLQDGTISFRNTPNAPVTLEPGGVLSPISRLGPTSLRLMSSTNAPANSLTFGPGEQVYDKAILANGENRLQANWLQVSPGSQVFVTNSQSRILGTVTNAGEINVVDGTLVFEGPVYFKPGASITGTGGRVIFDSAIYLPSGDIPVSPGISVQFETISSEGGRMLLAGSTMELNGSDIPWPPGLVTISNGIVTYVNTPDVPLGLPPGIDFVGEVGLRFVNSSNAFVNSHTFESGPDRYSRLYLTDDADRWQSRTLAIGQGGSLIITNSRPTVALEDRFFSVNSGGRFIDHTTNGNIGFSPNASGHTALVTDPGSVWTTAGELRIGDSGSSNHLIVSNGASIFSATGYLGMNTGSTANKVTLRGSNTLWFATNAVRLGFRGSSNVLEVSDGASLVSTGPLSLGASLIGYDTAIVSGEGSTATFGLQGTFIRGDHSRLLVTTGAVVRSTSMVLGQAFQTNNSVSVVGPGARLVHSADLSMQGRGTLLQVAHGGFFAISNITALPPSGLIEVTDDGSLFEVQQNFVLGNGAQLFVGAGATLKASLLGLTGSSDALRLVTSGRVLATNSTKTGLLNVRATAEILGGHLIADRIVATNGTNSRVFFHAGLIETRPADLNMAAPFSIGSGSAIARWHIVGATNYFRQGLTLQRFGELTGSGLVVGNVTNRGAIALQSSAATLAVTGALQFAESGTLAYVVDAPPQPTTPALLVNQGPLHLDGTLRVTLAPAYVPDPTNVYIVARYSAASGTFQNITAGRVLTADNLASFAVQPSTTELHLTDYRTEDADSDGIQDSWALRHFSITPLPTGSGVGARDGDDDGDGLSNSQEFRLGTDPHDSQSSLRLEITRHPSGGIALRFPYVSDWNYDISYSSDLQTWTTVANPQLNIGAAGAAEWIDAAPPSARFYRLLLRD